MNAAPAVSSATLHGSFWVILLVCTISDMCPKESPPGSFGPLALLAGSISDILTSAACFAAKARSATAASPAHMLYAEMKDIPTCIAIHLEVCAPSVVRETMVGMCTACQDVLPIDALICFAWFAGNSLSMSITYWRGSSSFSSSSPVNTFRSVSYTHLRAHETRHDLVCRLLLEKKKKKK